MAVVCVICIVSASVLQDIQDTQYIVLFALPWLLLLPHHRVADTLSFGWMVVGPWSLVVNPEIQSLSVGKQSVWKGRAVIRMKSSSSEFGRLGKQRIK